MENKIVKRHILLNRDIYTIGVTQNVTNRTAEKIQFAVSPEEIENFEMPGLASVFKTMTNVITNMDVEELSEPVQIYVTSQVYNIIADGTYKSWIMNSGKLKNGKQLSEEELAIYESFQEAVEGKSLFLSFRNYLRCRLTEKQLQEKVFKKLPVAVKDMHAITSSLEMAMDKICPRPKYEDNELKIANL